MQVEIRTLETTIQEADTWVRKYIDDMKHLKSKLKI